MKIPTRVRIWTHRAQDRYRDALAVLSGYCNDRAVKVGIPDGTGGYLHWRCALRRGHHEPHRYRNYMWDAQRRVEYAPVDHCPSQPWDRNGTPTRRQVRTDREWRQQQSEKRAAARRDRRA